MQKSIQKSMQKCMQKTYAKIYAKIYTKIYAKMHAKIWLRHCCAVRNPHSVSELPGAKLFGRQRLLRNFIKYTVQVNCFICTTKKVVTLRFDVGHIFIMITFSPS